MKIGLLAGGNACQHSSWWCHASPHDTNVLFILCMVSTAGSRHHNELNPKPQPLNPIFSINKIIRTKYRYGKGHKTRLGRRLRYRRDFNLPGHYYMAGGLQLVCEEEPLCDLF
ncbi:hypothetical protein ISS30_04450 [bacterium]|nr:hypothetical protein [bacterium]